jgi:hypothetical protein
MGNVLDCSKFFWAIQARNPIWTWLLLLQLDLSKGKKAPQQTATQTSTGQQSTMKIIGTFLMKHWLAIILITCLRST